jgi:AcrR family transcriptional regulator
MTDQGKTPGTPPETTGTTTGMTPKGDARRKAILDAATAVLVEDGHAGLSLRAVAGRAEIRLSNLQYYYRTREGLVAALLDRQLTEALERLREPLATSDAEELVRRLLADQCDRSAVVLFTEVWALAGRDLEVGVAVRDFYLRYQGLVERTVTVFRPDLAPHEISSRSRVFICLLEGASMFRAGVTAERDDESDRLLAATAIALLR